MDPVTSYAKAVVKKRIVAGRAVRLACERHLRDLKSGARRGIRFDADRAAKTIKFFDLLHLAEGEHAGKPFKLQPWQQFVVGSLFGWFKYDREKGDYFRRFRTAYLEIGKGNGKTPLAAAIGIIGLIADNEPGAEIYSAATMREQAGICFRDAVNMVKSSPSLKDRIAVLTGSLVFHERLSFFRTCSSEHRGLDGKRPHIAIIDELHEHPTAMVVDKMSAGTKGRRQPLIFEITNSGHDRTTVCYHHHEYSLKLLEGLLQNDSWFAYVCQLDPCKKCLAEGKTQPQDDCEDCDQWTDEAVWPKANPNLGVSITKKYLRQQVDEALGMPSKRNIVLRLNFCVWTESSVVWLPMNRWDECSGAVTEEMLRGQTCYGGLDLASTSDIAALALLFPPNDDRPEWAALTYFWCPEEQAAVRTERDRLNYMDWIRQGYIQATEGDVVDYNAIKKKILQLYEQFHIAEIAFDRWNATQITTDLDAEGLTMVPFGQGFQSMSAPAKALEAIVRDRALLHGGNPVLRWMASNCAVRQDPAGNIKPAKDKSTEKIDGIVALVMALGRATVQATAGSIYEEQGIQVF
jgi:phage terminase large subunit-like protein